MDSVSNDDKSTEPQTRDGRNIVTAWLNLILAFLIVATLAGLAARVSAIAELFVHFKLIYFLSSIVLIVTYAAIKRWRWVGVSTIVLMIHAPGIIHWYIPRQSPPAQNYATVDLLIANVWSGNRNYEPFLDFVRKRQPDILVIQEVTPEWRDALRPLESEGYYALVQPRVDNFGMATLSRIEPQRLERVMLNTYSQVPSNGRDEIAASIFELPVMELEFAIGRRTVQLLNLHPLPPLGSHYTAVRNRMLTLTRNYVQSTDDLVIVAGDLNVTPWSPFYYDAFNEAGLVNGRQGHGIFPTYPSIGLIPPAIPIDHVLVSPEIRVSHIEYTPEWDSDHAGLWVELAIPQDE